MYCVSNGKVCIQVWNTITEKWDYIPLLKWERMSDRQRRKYDTNM